MNQFMKQTNNKRYLSSTSSTTTTQTTFTSTSYTDTTLSPEIFISKIPPMKRILCLCPIIVHQPNHATSMRMKTNNNEGRKFVISMAVSDPYLAYATPIQPIEVQQQNQQNQQNPISNDYIDSSFHENTMELLLNHEYNDIGGILFGLPVQGLDQPSSSSSSSSSLLSSKFDFDIVNGIEIDRKENKEKQHQHIWNICKSLQKQLLSINAVNDQDSETKSSSISSLSKNPTTTTRNKISSINLFCHYNHEIHYNEALQMAKEEPEMWDEIDFPHRPFFLTTSCSSTVVSTTPSSSSTFVEDDSDDCNEVNLNGMIISHGNNISGITTKIIHEEESNTIHDDKNSSKESNQSTSIMHAGIILNAFLWKYTGG